MVQDSEMSTVVQGIRYRYKNPLPVGGRIGDLGLCVKNEEEPIQLDLFSVQGYPLMVLA